MASPPSIGTLSLEALSGLSDEEKTQKMVEAINGLRSTSVSSLNRGLTIANLDWQIHEFSVTVPDDWQSPTLLNGWVPFNPGGDLAPLYRKTPEGMVEIVGSVKNGAVLASAFVLPEGYWPLDNIQYATPSNGAYGQTLVQASDGAVIPYVGNNAFFHFGMIRFFATDRTPVAASCWPYLFRTTVKSQVAGVVALRVQDAEDSSRPVGVLSVDWDVSSRDGTKAIRIKNIPGLTPGRRHRVKLLVISE